MAATRDDSAYEVGDWRFDVAAGELSRGDERKRLEDRAARTLELLCRRRGQVISHQALVDAIWGGRALSPNSIAVVMADLRRALGDDAKNPGLIETVPKRGYRLAPQGARVEGPDVERRRWLALAAAGGAVGLTVALGTWLAGRPTVLLGVGRVANETGRREYDPLARSVSELTLTYLDRADGLSLVRGSVGAGEGRRFNLQGRLAMWSGLPTVYFTAVEPRTAKVVWTGMALGPEDALPARIDKILKELAAKLLD